MARYRITVRMYRDGLIHEPGTVYDFPDNVRPPKDSVRVEDSKGEAVKPPVKSELAKAGGRINDKSPI